MQVHKNLNLKERERERERDEVLEEWCLGQGCQVECYQSIEELW